MAGTSVLLSELQTRFLSQSGEWREKQKERRSLVSLCVCDEVGAASTKRTCTLWFMLQRQTETGPSVMLYHSSSELGILIPEAPLPLGSPEYGFSSRLLPLKNDSYIPFLYYCY